jgi:hypothetical protein
MNKFSFLTLAALLAACSPARAPVTSQPIPTDVAPFLRASACMPMRRWKRWFAVSSRS